MTLSRDQAEQVLREVIAPHSGRYEVALVYDQTDLLGSSLPSRAELQIAGKKWLVLAGDSVLATRRSLWERKPERVALVVGGRGTPTALRDLESAGAVIQLDGAEVLRLTAKVDLPHDPRVDSLVPLLLSRPDGLALLRDQQIHHVDLPRAIVSALLGEDLLAAPDDASTLARVIRSKEVLPDASKSMCRDFAATLPQPHQSLVRGLLTYEENRSVVAGALISTYVNYREGRVVSDPLVVDFLEKTAANEITLLSTYAENIQEAMLAEPTWGRRFADGLRVPEGVTKWSPVLPQALERDMRQQLDALVTGDRTALDDHLWQDHLFYEKKQPWVRAISRVATLRQLIDEITTFTQEDHSVPELVDAYVHRFCPGDLACIELEQLRKEVVELEGEIDKTRELYADARSNLNHSFAAAYSTEYPRYFGGKELLLTVDCLPLLVKPRLDAGQRVLLVIVDGLGFPLWRSFRGDLAKAGWRVEESFALSLLPSVTAVSRYAIFSGPLPARIYATLSEPDDSAPTEDEAIAMREALPGRKVTVFKKRELAKSLRSVAKAIKGDDYHVVVTVVNEIDDIVRSPAETPFPLRLQPYQFLRAVLDAGRQSRRAILLVSDHGFTPSSGKKWPVPEGMKVEQSRFLSGSGGEVRNMPAVWCENLVYEMGGPFLLLDDFGGRFSHSPRVGYHGGIGLEEVVVPLAWLEVGEVAPALALSLLDLPNEILEDEEVVVIIELVAGESLVDDLDVRVYLPGQATLRFRFGADPTLPFRRWEVRWKPTLPAQEPVEPTTMTLRAICSRADKELAHTEEEVLVRPRPGKYESAAAVLLP